MDGWNTNLHLIFVKDNAELRKETKRQDKLNKELLLFKEKFDCDNLSEIIMANE